MWYVLAVVEYDSAVWPAVMVHQAQIWKQTNTHCLEASLITHHEPITVYLKREGGRERG